MLLTCVLCFCNKANAQWVVTDPGNFAQSIINASNNIMHTSKTATNMVSNFQETVKIYEQGKKVLRRTEISKQSGKGCEKGAASNPDGRRYYGHLCEQLPEDAA